MTQEVRDSGPTAPRLASDSRSESPTIALTVAGVRWQTAPELIDHGLLGPDGLRLAIGTSIVKQGPHCTVYRVVLPELDVHVKHYHPADARSWARSLLRASKARGRGDARPRGGPVRRADAGAAGGRRGVRGRGAGVVPGDAHCGSGAPLDAPFWRKNCLDSLHGGGRVCVNPWQSRSAGCWPGCTTQASSTPTSTPATCFSGWGRATNRNCISSTSTPFGSGRPWMGGAAATTSWC